MLEFLALISVQVSTVGAAGAEAGAVTLHSTPTLVARQQGENNFMILE